jgi:signal transduction histidine kinase
MFAAIAVATGDGWMLLSGIGPAVLAAVCIVMLRRDIRRAELILVLAALSTVLSYRLYGTETSATPAAIGVVVIIAVSVLFVGRRWQWHYVAPGTIGLLLTGPIWHGFSSNTIWVSISAALSGGVAMAMFVMMRNAAVSIDRRYRLFVERMPVPLIEYDWSKVRDWVLDCRRRGVTDMASHLDAHPGVVEIVAASIELQGINPATVEVTRRSGLKDPEAMRQGVDLTQCHDFIRREIIGIFEATPPAASDHRVVLPDGSEVWTRLHAAELDDADVPGVDRVITAMDITELKQAQAQLADLVRSKDEFVAAVGHELRTPLTSVVGFAELLQAEAGAMTPESREMVENLMAQARDMAHIVEDLPVAARADIGTVAIHPQPTRLGDVVEAAVSGLVAHVGVHIDDDAVVFADPVRVGQILRNLVTNATRYGGERRSILVWSRGDRAVLDVRDDGPGIPLDDRERIIEPYTRAHDRPGMTASVGLGLAVSRQLADLMGGSLEYCNDGGHSTFRLSLPLAEADAAGEVA